MERLMPNTDAPELLPCPWCNGSPTLSSNETKKSYPDTWFVICKACNARGPEQYDGTPLAPPDAIVQPTVSHADCMRNAIAAWNTRASPAADAADRMWRHEKRGTVYREIGRAELQIATLDVVEGSCLVIYRGADGKLWARQEDEFEDGRFVEMAANPAADAQARHAADLEALVQKDERIRMLEKALAKLVNEVSVVIGIGEVALRHEVGNTNVNVLILRVEEAGAALGGWG